MGLIFTPHARATSPYGPDINAPSDDSSDSTGIASHDNSSDDNSHENVQGKSDADKNWLIQNYEQVRAGSASSTGGKSADPLDHIRANKELARLAGLAPADDGTSLTLRLGVTGSSAGSPALRADPSLKSSSAYRPFISTTFKPLLPPLGKSSGTSATGVSSPILGGDQRAAVSTRDTANDSADIETPGMTAVEKNPQIDKVSADLMFDMSSSAANARDRASESDEVKDALPMSTNLERIQKQDAASLQAPGSAVKVVQPVPINPLQIKLPPDLEPMKMITPSPVHPQIPDPRDPFYH